MKENTSGPYSYLGPHDHPKIIWPGGARLALWVIPNIESFALNEVIASEGPRVPNVRAFADREYGARVGIWRLIEAFDECEVRATVALNSEVCDRYPPIIEAGLARDWEWMGHNESNTRYLDEYDPGEEPQVIQRTLSRIESSTGTKPKGWLSSGLRETWNTLDYLAEAGCEYVADWVNDDRPYMMDLEGAQMVSMPYTTSLNDKPAVDFDHVTGEEFAARIRRQFDVLWRESADSGKVMAIAVHPYITGVGHRIDPFREALRYVTQQTGVWRATGSEIVRHYLSQTVIDGGSDT